MPGIDIDETDTKQLEYEKLPFEIQSFISRQQRTATEANQCDHRATYQRELDNIRDTCAAEYVRGQAWVATLPAQMLRQCQAVYELNKKQAEQADRRVWWKSSNELTTIRVEGVGHVIAPSFLTALKQTKALAEIFTPI